MKRKDYLQKRRIQGLSTRIARMQDQKNRMYTRLVESESLETKRRMQHEKYTENLRNKISAMNNNVERLQSQYDEMQIHN